MKKSEYPDLSLIFLLMFAIALLSIIILIIDGASNYSEWKLGFLFLALLISLFIFIRKMFRNIGIFFILLFSCLWLIPTFQYFLYCNNQANYIPSESFIKNESTLINEKLKGNLNIKDLNEVVEIIKNCPENSIKLEGGRKNLLYEDLLNLNKEYTFNIERTSSMNKGKFDILISKGNNVKTEFHLESHLPSPYKSDLIDKINETKKETISLLKFKKEKTGIPYSEFLIDAITVFSSGDISPARNLPKILNCLQGILLLFLSTILINSFGELKLIRLKR